MKILVVLIAIAFIASVCAGTPEKWSDETYDFIKNFKGEKNLKLNKKIRLILII